MILSDIHQLWSSAWPAGAIMLGLGLGFAIVLLIASEKLKVHLDPKLEQVYTALPHLDCGGCGFAGCLKYAQAMIENPQLIGRCGPGGPATSQNVGKILNLQISDSGPAKRPIVHCRAHIADKTYLAKYDGLQSCTAANALPDAQACHFGCLGFGDCVRACKFDALHIVEGLATVDYEKCTGCTACSKACPRNIITMVPFGYDPMMTVACSNKETGKVTRSMCKVGCIACGLCAKQTDVFAVQDNLARLDYTRYQPTPQSQTAMEKCPTKVIVHRGKSVLKPTKPAERPAATVEV